VLIVAARAFASTSASDVNARYCLLGGSLSHRLPRASHRTAILRYNLKEVHAGQLHQLFLDSFALPCCSPVFLFLQKKSQRVLLLGVGC